MTIRLSFYQRIRHFIKTPVWVVGLIVLAVLVFFAVPRAQPVETTTVDRGSIVQTIVATGHVETPSRAEIASQVTATVEQVWVREGDHVQQGQLLVTLRDNETLAALNQAKASVSEVKALQRQLLLLDAPVRQQTVRQAEANLKIAQADMQRVETLVAQGFFSQARLDEAQRTIDNARAALSIARAQAQASSASGTESQLLQTRLAQAQATRQLMQARADNMRLTAPFDGLVLARDAEPGAVAQAGHPLMTVAQSGEIRLYVNVDEKNIRFIQPGFRARAVADAYPHQYFDAQVYFVAPAVDPLRGTVEVRLRVVTPPAFVKPDMTVSVEMMVGQKEQTLRMSSDAIRESDGERPYALVIREGKAEKVPVKLGLRGVGTLEILEGLKEGDVVIVSAASASPGDRVRSHPRAVKDKGIEPPAGMVR